MSRVRDKWKEDGQRGRFNMKELKEERCETSFMKSLVCEWLNNYNRYNNSRNALIKLDLKPIIRF